MKKKTFLIATLLSIALPVVFVITSCTNTNNRIHVILSNKTLSINDDTIACVFIGTSSKDVITCNSVYHPTYLDIGEYNPSLKALFIHKTNLAVNETIQTPLSFYNHGKLFETINIDILADGASLDYSQYINERTMSLAYLYQDGSDTMISRGTG
jgi:hypothetical protein